MVPIAIAAVAAIVGLALGKAQQKTAIAVPAVDTSQPGGAPVATNMAPGVAGGGSFSTPLAMTGGGAPVAQSTGVTASTPVAGVSPNPNPASYSPALGITSGYPGYDLTSQGGVRGYMEAQGYQFEAVSDPSQATYVTTDTNGGVTEQGRFVDPRSGKQVISHSLGSGPIYSPGTGTMGGPGGGDYRAGQLVGYYHA